MFKSLCESVQKSRGGECPLPRTLDDVKSKLNFLKSQPKLAKTTSSDLLKEFGFKQSPLESNSVDAEAQVIAQQIAYQCMEQALVEKDSIGLASHTYIPTVETIFDEFTDNIQVVDRVKLYGHHWNIHRPKVSKEGSKTTVCGHLDHNIKYNQNDSIDYKYVFENGKLIDEKIKIDGISKPTTPYTDMTFGMGYEGYPAVNMTHFAASKFCKWLSLVSGNYYRLPTEAEWEYTCRAESNSDYYFGDDINQIDNYAWHKDNSGDKYQKVGLKEPNKWGIYDMLGNVSEWVADSYEENIFKSKKLRSDPFIFNKSKYPKVYRGGSWNDKPDQLLTYKRFYSNSSLQERDPQIPKSKWWNTDAPNIGFRIVRVENIDSESLRDKFWNN